MEEPTYDLIANPISSFTTFGEAAPSPEATVEGMPAPPIDEYGPLLAQLTQLSNTITGIVMDNRKLQSEGDLIQGQIAGEQISPEDLNNLAQEQKENGLGFAQLVDAGLIKDDESPWFKRGAMRALAQRNLFMAEQNFQSNINNDFYDDTSNPGLSQNPEVNVAVAQYISNTRNPLNLSPDILENFYYSSAFEEGFSKFRRRATMEVVGLRNRKERQDQEIALQADILDRLTNPQPISPSDYAKSALRLSKGEITKEEFDELTNRFDLNPLEAVEDLISDVNYRSVFGSQGAADRIGQFLVEQAVQGNRLADEVLQTAKMSNGQSLLDYSDRTKVDYDSKKSRIDEALGKSLEAEQEARNNQRVSAVKEAVIQGFKGDPAFSLDLMSDENLNNFGLLRKDGKIHVQLEGGVTSELKMDQLKNQALEEQFRERLQYVAANNPGEPAAKYMADTMTWSSQGGYANPAVKSRIDQTMRLVSSGAIDLTPEQLTGIQTQLDVYRQVRSFGNKNALNAYYSGDVGKTMFLIDLLERGAAGDFIGSPTGTGIAGAVATLQRINIEEDTPKMRGLEQAFMTEVKERNLPTAITDHLMSVARIAVSTGQLSPDAVIEEIFNRDLVVKGEYYTYSPFTSPGMTPDIANQFFDTQIEYVFSGLGEGDEGSLHRYLRDVVWTNSGAVKESDEEFADGWRKLNFEPATFGEPGSFIVTYNGYSTDNRVFTFSDLEEADRIRVSKLGPNRTLLPGADQSGFVFMENFAREQGKEDLIGPAPLTRNEVPDLLRRPDAAMNAAARLKGPIPTRGEDQ